jgi:acetate---CoA ligase (ADP-forming)
MLSPHSVAIVGASASADRIGGRAVANLRERGFSGAIDPVNPSRDSIQGYRCYAAIADLPGVPDVAIIAVPAAHVPATAEALARRGVGAAIVFSAGFSEGGKDGYILQEQLLARVRANGMRILGPNALGVVDVRSNFYGTFASTFFSGFPTQGRIGIARQSRAFCGHLMAVMRERRIGIASCVMTGNEADITVAEVIAAIADDHGIDVITVYVEGIKNGAAFIAALKHARAARKPVIVMKVGRSSVGEKAVLSHTAAIAGSDAVIDAVLAEYGALRAQTTEEMLDIAQLATRRIYPVHNTLGVLTVSGGGGVLIADAAERERLAMPPLPAAAQQRLKALLPIASPVNPIDCTAQVLNELELFGEFAESMARDGGYSSMLTFLSYTAYAPALSVKLRAELSKILERYPDRLLAVCIVASPETIAAFEAAGIAVFEGPSRAVVAIAAMGRLGKAFAGVARVPPPNVPNVDLPARAVSELEAKQLLALAGLRSAPERIVSSVQAAGQAAEELGLPVA